MGNAACNRLFWYQAGGWSFHKKVKMNKKNENSVYCLITLIVTASNFYAFGKDGNECINAVNTQVRS